MIVLPITILAAAVVASYFALQALATPSEWTRRTTRLADEDRQVERLKADATAPARYDAQTVCPSFDSFVPAQYGAQLTRQLGRLRQSAARIGAPSVVPVATPRLRSYAVEIEGAGSYPEVIHMLSRLSQARPRLFVQTLDLQAMPGGVALTLRGNVLCSTSVR